MDDFLNFTRKCYLWRGLSCASGLRGRSLLCQVCDNGAHGNGHRVVCGHEKEKWDHGHGIVVT